MEQKKALEDASIIQNGGFSSFPGIAMCVASFLQKPGGA